MTNSCIFYHVGKSHFKLNEYNQAIDILNKGTMKKSTFKYLAISNYKIGNWELCIEYL